MIASGVHIALTLILIGRALITKQDREPGVCTVQQAFDDADGFHLSRVQWGPQSHVRCLGANMAGVVWVCVGGRWRVPEQDGVG